MQYYYTIPQHIVSSQTLASSGVSELASNLRSPKLEGTLSLLEELQQEGKSRQSIPVLDL